MSAEELERQETSESSDHWSVISRRTLLRAGWTAPVILTVAPAVAFAASGTTPGSTVNPGGSKTSTGTPTSTTATPASSTGPAGSSGPSGGGVPEQQSSGPEPAKIQRGFTG